MFIDICFPNGNEDEFVRAAKDLGTSELLFVYDDPKKVKLVEGIKSHVGTLVEKAPRKRLPGLTLASGNRSLFEAPRIDMLFGQEKLPVHDSLHQPQSGMNEVLASILARKKKAYGVCIQDLIENPKLVRRFKQNIMLCEKSDVPLVLASFAREPYGLRSEKTLMFIGKYLGMKEPKIALNNLSKRLA